jgi:hypothetical protein
MNARPQSAARPTSASVLLTVEYARAAVRVIVFMFNLRASSADPGCFGLGGGREEFS